MVATHAFVRTFGAEVNRMTDPRPLALRRAPEDLLRVRGDDAVDLFQRIAASDVTDLERPRVVVFTDEKGRVIDAPTVIRRDDHLVLVCGPTRGPALREWIEKWVIMEDVTVEPLDETVVEVLADDPREPSGFVFDPPAPDTAYALIDLDAWREHFVEAGIVVPGPALAAAPNPLEIGWHDRIGWTKGCYIGQEVVARLDTYDKVKRHVARLRFGTPRTGEPLPVAGTAVRFEGRRVGVLLDVTPADALAALDKGVAPGSVVEIDDAGTATVRSTAADEA